MIRQSYVALYVYKFYSQNFSYLTKRNFLKFQSFLLNYLIDFHSNRIQISIVMSQPISSERK